MLIFMAQQLFRDHTQISVEQNSVNFTKNYSLLESMIPNRIPE